jgi:hypothetical protein
MANVIVAFRNFANARRNIRHEIVSLFFPSAASYIYVRQIAVLAASSMSL